MITLDNFEDFVPYKIWMRGEEYYETDAVSELEEISPGEWTATVEGTDDYNVEISMDGNEIESWYCDCPYEGEICKHVVATLLAIRDNRKKAGNSIFSKMKIKAEEAPVLEEIKEVGKQPCPSLVDIQQLLSFIDPQELSKFICEYASTNLEFKTALSNHFIAKELSLSSKGKDYRIEIQKVFKRSGYHKRSRYHNRYDNYDRDWKTIFNQMDTFLEKADFFLNLEAMDNSIAIALQVLRSIGENYDDELLYDGISSSDYCEQAGDLLLKVIEHPKTTQAQKMEILQGLREIAEISIFREYDLYDVDELMMQINLSVQPAEKALELIDELLEVRKGTCGIYQLVLRKVNLLLEQNEEQKADDTIRQYLYLTEIRRMEVDKLIARCQYDEAICLLNDGIEIAEREMHSGTVGEWLKMKLDIYEITHRVSEVIDTCRLLFVVGSDKLIYYSKLKTLVPKEQWKSFLDRMMKEAELSDYFSFGGNDKAEIYVKEKDNDSLFSLLSSVRYNQLETLMKYAHYLKDTHSEKLIAIYTSLLNDYAERNLGREHYEFIARVLSCIRKLNGGQAVVKSLVAEFRIKYKRRPAMMEVLGTF